MKRLFLTITTTFLFINSSPVKAKESNNEYKKVVCEEYLSDAVRWAENQGRIDRIYNTKDVSFWTVYEKLVNRCKSYDQNTIKTIENDYARVYAEYWD